MALRRLIVLSLLGTAVVVTVPAAAMARTHGAGQGAKADRSARVHDHLLEGTGTGTNTVNLATGAATYESSGHLSHFGAVTGHGTQTITPTGPNSVSFTGFGVTVAANGDQLFTTISGTGTLTPRGVAIARTLNTIIDGTGRFAGATGTFTVISESTPISTVGSVETFGFTSATEGRISF